MVVQVKKCAFCGKVFQTNLSHKKYCSKQCRDDHQREYLKLWRINHKDKQREYFRKYVETHREAYKLYRRRYMREWARKHYALMKQQRALIKFKK